MADIKAIHQKNNATANVLFLQTLINHGNIGSFNGSEGVIVDRSHFDGIVKLTDENCGVPDCRSCWLIDMIREGSMNNGTGDVFFKFPVKDLRDRDIPKSEFELQFAKRDNKNA